MKAPVVCFTGMADESAGISRETDSADQVLGIACNGIQPFYEPLRHGGFQGEMPLNVTHVQSSPSSCERRKRMSLGVKRSKFDLALVDTVFVDRRSVFRRNAKQVVR